MHIVIKTLPRNISFLCLNSIYVLVRVCIGACVERKGEASRYHCSFLFDLRVAPSKIACQYKACLYLTFYDMVLNAKAKLCLTEANQKRSCMLRNP